jgi:hypothetical protein
MKFRTLLFIPMLLPVLALFQNCSTLMPREQRKVEFIQDTKLKKKEIYDRSLVYISKTFAAYPIPNAIKDEANGRIVTLSKVSCEGLGYFTYPLNTTKLEANLDITAKDNKFRIIFDDIQLKNYNPYGNIVYSPHPSDDARLKEMVEKCLLPLKDELVNSIEGKGIKTDKEF